METTIAGKAAKRVWVVDDDETVLMLAEEILTGEGFAVATFADAPRALAAAQAEPPDIIVLDVLMPGLDGFEFCTRLRSSPGGQDVPVLMATSLEDLTSINRAYEAGATDFATKPINWALETHRLRYLLRAADTARQLKLKERETRQAKEDWERTFNSFSDIVTLLGPDLRVIRANSAAVKALEKPLDAILGVPCYQLFVNADSPCPGCPVAEVMRSGGPGSAEMPYRHPHADCLVTAAPVMDENGRLLHAVHMARDLTVQKQLEAQYRHAQKMEAMGTFAGGVAHDFNNILMVVSGYAELLARDPQSTAGQTDCANTILQAAQRGAALSRQLLTFSRKGVARAGKRPIVINDVVRDVQKMLQRVLSKNVVVHTHLAPDLRQTHAAAEQVLQILMNLAVNASHAMPDGGVLTIETSNVHVPPGDRRLQADVQPGDFALLSVSDTGHGMDKQVLDRIYEPFFTTKKVGEGTGLGMSVVFGIVKEHSGIITCESEVGVGTSFKIYFPALAPSAGAASDAPPAELKLPRGTETILVVDDEADIRSLLRSCLASVGYTVISAEDGENALIRYYEARDRIRLVLMDLGMPGMGGWECLKRLQVLDPSLPVLITTGYGGDNLLDRARQCGAVGLIGKPYETGSLCRRVREVLDLPRREVGGRATESSVGAGI